MTPDLLRLREKQSELAPVLARLELELVDDPAWAAPVERSRLGDSDRGSPEGHARLTAIEATNKLVAWFGRDRDGYVGLWRGTEELTLTEAPVVRLDVEGRYSIIAATIPDYLAISMPEDEFVQARDSLARAGFRVSMNPDAIWAALDAFEDPNLVRDQATGQVPDVAAIDQIDDIDELETDDLEELAAVAEPVAPRLSGPIEVVESEQIVEETLADDDRFSGATNRWTEAAAAKPATASRASAKPASAKPASAKPATVKRALAKATKTRPAAKTTKAKAKAKAKTSAKAAKPKPAKPKPAKPQKAKAKLASRGKNKRK
jgi:hypothetical protein